jgi:hypothetical protein
VTLLAELHPPRFGDGGLSARRRGVQDGGMRATDLLRNRINAVNALLHDIVESLAGVDLVTPVVPGTSPLGLTLWHVPRSQDWAVQTCVRGVREIVDDFADGLPDPETYGFGTALTPETARDAAAAVDLPRLLAYADAVTATVDGWLAGVTEDDLDAVPDVEGRQRTRAAYATPEALAEAAGLFGVPAGHLLLRPALAHCYVHLGEVETLVQVARS